jgi:hypothetical protein
MIVIRSPWLPVLGAAVWAVAPLASAADPLTVGVLTCAAESDRDHRLDCYDRAVANYTAGLTSNKRDPAGAPAVGVGGTPVPPGGVGAATAAVAGAPPSPATVQPGSAAVAAAPAPATGKQITPAARHVAASIVSIDHFPDYVVIHLDNQQTWKQVSDSPGGPALRTGDPVTIDKEMGSYWLAGPKGEAVQVKLEVLKP